MDDLIKIISIDEPAYKIIRLILTLNNKKMYLINTQKLDDIIILRFREIKDFFTNNYYQYVDCLKNERVGINIKNNYIGRRYKKIEILNDYYWTITKEDLNEMIELLLNNSIYRDEYDSERHIKKYLYSSYDGVLNITCRFTYNSIQDNILSEENIINISNYFKIDNKEFSYIKPILQTYTILGLNIGYFNVQHLPKIIKKFNFKFELVSEKIEHEIDKILNVLLDTNQKKFVFRLSKYVTITLKRYLKEITLKISGINQRIIARTLNFDSNDSINFLRKRYIYSFLYNNNLISKFEIDSLRSLVTYM